MGDNDALTIYDQFYDCNTHTALVHRFTVPPITNSGLVEIEFDVKTSGEEWDRGPSIRD